MWNRNIETFLGCDCSYEDSHIVIFGAPFDSTTSYRPGTRFASRTMRAESYGLETYSPYQDLDLEEACVFDGGDLELPFGDTERALDMIRMYTREILQGGKLPLLIGGEHLVSLPAIEAAANMYPELSIIHFDAHTDLREEYLGNRFSHATVINLVMDVFTSLVYAVVRAQSGNGHAQDIQTSTPLLLQDFPRQLQQLQDALSI